MDKISRIGLWTVIFGVLLLAIVAIWYFLYWQPQESLEGLAILPTAEGDGPNHLVNDLTPPSLNYTQAVAIFNNARIQFDGNCKIQPATLAVRNGSTVMFDNRWRNALGFSMDGVRYTLPGYGFKLLRLTSPEAPYTVTIACGANGPGGTIELQ